MKKISLPPVFIVIASAVYFFLASVALAHVSALDKHASAMKAALLKSHAVVEISSR